MDFFRRLKGLIPIVSASEPESGNVRNVEPEVVEEVLSESDTADSNPGDKVIDLSKKPEIFSDILVNRDSDYEYYPERLNGRYKPSLWNKVFKFEGKEEFTRMSCEKKLYKLIQEEPLLKLLVGALKTAGCDIDIRRNFSCEVCYSGVCGGYDTETQQVVICMNNVSSEGYMATILAHELIHMYDHCVNETNFTKPEHLACTEIRAINLTSCSLIDSFFAGYVSTMDLIKKDYGKKHTLCVKERALKSVMAASSGICEEEARKTIDKVFPYCYNDLEPIGRRMRHKTDDNDRAFLDGKHYGYV